jgi:MFS family permease
MLLVLAAGWATLQTGRFLLPALLPRISDALEFSPSGTGLTLTAFGLVYAIVQYPSGSYSDTLSRATLILPGFAVVLLGFVLVGLSVTASVFVLGVVAVGIGKGLYASPSRALLDDRFDARRGAALGIFTAGTDLGGLVASGLAVAVLATTAWRTAFLPVVCVLAAVAVLFVVWNTDPYELRRVRLDPGRTVGRIVASRRQREMLLAFSLFYFFTGGLTNFFPTLLVARGFSEAAAGGSFALLFVVGLVMKPAAGNISDRFSRLGVAVGGLAVTTAGIASVLLAPTLAVVALGTALTAVGYKAQLPIVDALVMEAAPEGNTGGDLGAARAVFLGANALGPGAVGVIADFAGFETAFVVLSSGLVVGTAVLVRSARR